MALLKNSKITGDGVIKSIALNAETMLPRPVLKAVRSGEPEALCTQQEVNKGDIVVMSNNESGDSKVDVLRVTSVSRYKIYMSKITAATVDMNEGADINWMGLFETCSEDLRDWLVNKDDSPLLPQGYGWDGGRTRYEEAKVAEFMNLLSGIDESFKNSLVEWAMVSPRDNVSHEWKTSQPIPRDPINLAPGPNVESHFTILWTDFGVDVFQYVGGDYTEEYLSITTLQNDAVNKALVGTVVTNKYGKNVRWKLYS